MQGLSLISNISLYMLMAIMGIISVIVWVWQIGVLKGKAMKNPDGSFDDWHKQRTHYGIAVADVFLACPLNIVGTALVFIVPRWGFYLLALICFWWIWANTMTTATSLRFWKPKIDLIWIIVYPFGILVGLAYFVWSIIHFDIIYAV